MNPFLWYKQKQQELFDAEAHRLKCRAFISQIREAEKTFNDIAKLMAAPITEIEPTDSKITFNAEWSSTGCAYIVISKDGTYKFARECEKPKVDEQ
jgi:hypothetical protein